MSKTNVLYQRGDFKLVRTPGRTNLEILWYDPETKRGRHASARTADVEAGKAALDHKYLEITKGVDCCPHCLRPYDLDRQVAVPEAIEAYLVATEDRPGYEGIVHRLSHVLDYLATLQNPGVPCQALDDHWVDRFRRWLDAKPIVSPKGHKRMRAPSTTENSVMQLAAAIRHMDIVPRFKVAQPKDVNRTPRYRADLTTIGRMFTYALEPKKKRENLLAFLRVSVLTLARPDAACDASVSPKREQWHAEAGVFDLNPRGRRQTKKYRAIVPIPPKAHWIFNEADGYLVKGSPRSAWEGMAKELKLPADRQSGTKLIRRSMADIVRKRLVEAERSVDQLEVFLGHRNIGSVSELYAPFDPSYLSSVQGIIADLIEEIEGMASGAFLPTSSPKSKSGK